MHIIHTIEAFGFWLEILIPFITVLAILVMVIASDIGDMS